MRRSLCVSVCAQPDCVSVCARCSRGDGWRMGVGASLTMESIPAESRGCFGHSASGLSERLSARIAGLWRAVSARGLARSFHDGARARVARPLHPPRRSGIAWLEQRARKIGYDRPRAAPPLRLALYAILLMTCFNFFSHGTQDIYKTFLKVEHLFDVQTTSTILIVMNVGAILGGLTFGTLSQRFGRRRMLIASALLSLPVIHFGFIRRRRSARRRRFRDAVPVQGCWGIIPAHLNELSPTEARATFPVSSTSSEICLRLVICRCKPGSPSPMAATRSRSLSSRALPGRYRAFSCCRRRSQRRRYAARSAASA